MAYIPNRLKAVSAGSGRAPAVYTYRTDDSIAAVTTLGYFAEAVSIFEVGDIVWLNPDNGTGLTKIICVKSLPVDGGAHEVDFSTFLSFAGDIRATDATGYRPENFSGNIGAGSGCFNYFTYRNNTDAKAVILAANYFDREDPAAPTAVDGSAGLFLEIGDIIEVIANDGTFMARVLTVGAGSTTTEEIIFA